jgi:hypothetical protein
MFKINDILKDDVGFILKYYSKDGDLRQIYGVFVSANNYYIWNAVLPVVVIQYRREYWDIM